MPDADDERIAQDLRRLESRLAGISVSPILLDLIALLTNRPPEDGEVQRNGRSYDLDGNDVSTSWAADSAGHVTQIVHILAGVEFMLVTREGGEETTASLLVSDALANPSDLEDFTEAMNA